MDQCPEFRDEVHATPSGVASASAMQGDDSNANCVGVCNAQDVSTHMSDNQRNDSEILKPEG